MHTNINLKHSRIFIYDLKKEHTVADTYIQTCDTERMIISISHSLEGLLENDKVSVLILLKDSILEYKGTVRRVSHTGYSEIALYQGHNKEDRKAVRYKVNVPARIDNLLISNRPVPLRTPLNGTVINISTNGILVRTSLNAFNIGTSFQLMILMNELPITLNTCVQRMEMINETEAEYGCELTGKFHDWH